MRTTRHHRAFAALALIGAALLASAGTAVAAAPSPAPLVVIDPGHGGRYSNANANGLKEKTVNLQIALELRRQLIARGYRVLMTRTTDRAVQLKDGRTWNYSSSRETWSYAKDGRTGTYGGIPKDDLQARARIANQAGADLFISVHANGAASRSARGTETWSSSRDRLGTQLAPYVHTDIVRSTGLRSRGAYRADFYVCRWTNMPAVLVEAAFISNSKDAALLKSRAFRSRIASGIANGVDRWMATKPYRKVYPRISASSPASLSAAVSQADFAGGAPVAVIAREDHATDLPGVPGLAVALGGPLLWTGASELSTSTAAELARLAPQTLVLAGVEGSFDDTAVAQLAAASGIATSAVELLSAADTGTLSAAIATRVGVPPNGEMLVVPAGDTGAKLAAAPVSAARRIPVLIVDDSGPTPEALSLLHASSLPVSRFVLVGKAVRPSSVASGATSVRVDGATITEKAAALNKRYFKSTAARATRPVVASYASPAGYLTASGRAGRTLQPLIPVTGRVLPAFTREWITNKRSQIGGFTLIDDGSMTYLMDAMLAKAAK